MRNLKKILALVLALMMTLSVMVTAGASNYVDGDQINDAYAEAVEVLTGMGIYKGQGDGSNFAPKSTITRAETSALVYRILTADVKDTQTGIYADYNKFEDVNSNSWYAGYVNYAANGEYIIGDGQGHFYPMEKVTGYQLLAIMLRAIGYGQKGEFVGAGWEIRTATQAKELGITDGITDTTLGQPATRELVAELLFRAIQVTKVDYTPAFGYTTIGNNSIGWDNFGLTSGDYTDVWGRPGTQWYNAKKASVVYATIMDTPVATYTTAVTECDVASDYGFTGTKAFDTYTNGAVNKGADTLNALATRATIGAQGRLTEVYADRIVYIDTFFAVVTSVSDAKFDAAGHLAKEATLVLDVYAADNTATKVTLTNGATNWEYTAGQALLVNAVTDNAGLHSDVDNSGTSRQYVKIVGAAQSFVGAQSTIWNNASKHTVGGKDYDDALHFHRDDAGNSTVNHNWWLDQYGNLIAVTDIARSNYAVLKDLIWIVGRPGYAEATLVYMDGSEATVTVNRIDGFDFDAEDWDSDNFVPTLEDAANVGFASNNANVSSDSKYNTMYEGYALYRVDTLDNGTVNLQGVENRTDIIDYNDYATLDIDASAIVKGGNVVAHVDNDTQFLVNNGNGTYTAYTGTASLPDFAHWTIEVFYDATTVNGIADYVYIKDFALQSDFGTHLFTTTKTYTGPLTEGNVTVYTMSVVIDGETRTIKTDDKDIIDTLVANQGKLFHVEFNRNTNSATYGYVTEVRLVNEVENNENACNYLSSAITVGNGTIVCNGVSYNVNYATEIVNAYGLNYDVADLAEAVREGCGIWVVSDTAPYNKATTIYIGTKLSSDTTLTVTSTTNGANVAWDAAGTTCTVTLPEDVTSGNVTATVGQNAVLVTDGVDPISSTVGTSSHSETKQADSQRSYTVWAEDGVASQTYTVKVVGTNDWANIFTKVTNAADNTELLTGPVKGYKNVALACNNVYQLDLGSAGYATFHTETGATSIEYRVFTDTASAINAGVNDYQGMTSNTLSETLLLNGNILMVEVGTAEGTFYTAFQITNPAN